MGFPQCCLIHTFGFTWVVHVINIRTYVCIHTSGTDIWVLQVDEKHIKGFEKVDLRALTFQSPIKCANSRTTSKNVPDELTIGFFYSPSPESLSERRGIKERSGSESFQRR